MRLLSVLFCHWIWPIGGHDIFKLFSFILIGRLILKYYLFKKKQVFSYYVSPLFLPYPVIVKK